MRIFQILLFSIILNVSPLFARGVSLEAKTDKQSITVGERFNYRVDASYPKDFTLLEVVLPEIEKDLYIFGMDRSPESTNDGKKSAVDIAMTAFSTGTVLIPEITFKFKDSKGSIREIKTSTVKIKVESVLDKYGVANDIRDVKKPFKLEASFVQAVFLILLIVFVILVLIKLYYKYFKKKAEKLIQKPKPVISAEEKALNALSELKNSNLLNEGRIKEFYTILSEILRVFVYNKFGADTLDKTTSEIYAGLKALSIDKKRTLNIKEVLENSDLVKFAKYTPDNKESLKDMETAEMTVNWDK